MDGHARRSKATSSSAAPSRGSSRWSSRSCPCCSWSTRSWPCASSPPTTGSTALFVGHMNLMHHADTTLWWLQVVTGFALFFLGPRHLYQMLMHPEGIGPYESADRVWSETWWPLYLVLLFCVELHGGIGPVPAGREVGLVRRRATPIATRRRLKPLKWAITAFFLALGLATLAAYMKIGIEHRDRAGEDYVPSWVQPSRAIGASGDEDHLHRCARHRRRARRTAHGDRRQAPRPRGDHPVARAAQALALQGRAGRHAGEPRQRHQGAGRQRGRALRGHGARQRLGRRPASRAHVRQHRAQGGARARRLGRAVEPRPQGRPRRSSSTARRSPSPSATRRTACWRSATSAAPRSGAPATSRTAPATRCSPPWPTRRSPTRSRCTSAPRRSR